MNRKACRTGIRLFLIALFVTVCFLAACGQGKTGTAITSVDQLKQEGVRIGVPVDTSHGQTVEKLFPQAEIEYFKEDMEGFISVSQGKIDAYVFNKIAMQTAIRNGLKGVRLLEGTVGEPDTSAVAFSPVSRIPDLKEKVNAFLAEVRADGTLDDMTERWVVKGDETMPEIPVPASSDLHLRVGTTGLHMPFTYYVGTELAGYDIELAYRFAAYLGATIEFKVYDYDAIVPAAQSGDVDCIFANLFITAERAEAVQFSDPTFVGEVGAIVRDPDNTAEANAAVSGAKPQIADYARQRIAVMTGSNFPEIVSEDLPDAEQIFYNTVADMLIALKTNKVDAIAIDEPVARSLITENPEITIAEGYLEEFDFAYFFPKTEGGQELCDEVSAFLREKKEDGTMEELQKKWFDSVPEEAMMSVDPGELPDTNGSIMVATLQYPPFSMQGEKMFFGYEVELLTLFCRERGYAIGFMDMNADATLPAIQSGRCDMAAAAASVTEERKEEMLFSEPDYSGGVVLAVRAENTAGGSSFFDSVRESFHKTFIRENRYRLFLSGIGMTILIVVLSILFGTLLGFLIFLACRRGNRVANFLAHIFQWLMSGMPMVVLLMILYYIIFGRLSISGSLVAVIGFALVFGAEVFGLMTTAVGAVDGGQMEAAFALGYTDRRAFFRHILPQAMPHFLPGYRGGLVNLVKATSIVGYIAVQDLTKMGDIVRSRTYEAFYPLIAVAIIYFVLAGILVFVVDRITARLDPAHRKKEDVLKGVKIYD